MDLLEVIYSRRTVHSYTSELVPEGILKTAIAAATHAPNHKQTWPWRFIFSGPKTRLQLADLQARLKEEKTKTPLTESARKSLVDKFMEPGALIVLAVKKSADPLRAREDYAALACAVQNMSLYLYEKGYGSKWGTGDVIRSAEAYDLLDISKDEFELCGLFWVGRPREIPPAPRRPDAEQFILRRE